jgi:hypothetical protein
MILWAFDTNTYSVVDSLTFSGIASATFGKLYTWGTDGIAYADPARLIIGSGSFTANGGAAVPTTTPDLAMTGSVTGSAGALNYQMFLAGALDVVADKCGNTYVSTSGVSDFRPNSVVLIDSSDGSAKASVYAGSEPYYLAVSDDCTAVYAGLAQSSSISRIDAASMTLSETIPLPVSDEWGFVTARSLSVAPGAPHTVAVATESDGTGCLAIDNNVTIFDDSIPRSIAYSDPNLPLYDVRAVVFGATANVLYGFELSSDRSGPSLASFTVDSTGVYNKADVMSLRNNFAQDGGRMINFDPVSGRVYDQLGDMYDTTSLTGSGQISLNVGPYEEATQCGTLVQAMTADRTTGKIFYVTWLGGGAGLEIDAYDNSTLSLLATAQVPFSDRAGDFGDVLRVARTASNSLAVVTATGQLVLLQGPMLAP